MKYIFCVDRGGWRWTGHLIMVVLCRQCDDVMCMGKVMLMCRNISFDVIPYFIMNLEKRMYIIQKFHKFQNQIYVIHF